MNHKKKFNHLSRTSAHRKAMLSNMAASLILNKRNQPRQCLRLKRSKYMLSLWSLKVKTITPILAVLYLVTSDRKKPLPNCLAKSHRKSWIVREVYPYSACTGNRIGDNAETCIIELVDFNATYTEVKQEVKKTTTRRRRSSGAKKAEATGAAVVEEAPKAETPAEEAPKAE